MEMIHLTAIPALIDPTDYNKNLVACFNLSVACLCLTCLLHSLLERGIDFKYQNRALDLLL